MADDQSDPDAETPNTELRAKIAGFLAQQLERIGDQECVGVELSYTNVVRDQLINAFPAVNPPALLELVDLILGMAEADCATRPVGIHRYVVCATQRNGVRTGFKFGVTVTPPADEEQPAYFYMTMRTIRIKNPIEIEISTSPNTKLIRLKEPLDIEITHSVDSSHAPAVRREAPLEAIVAALSPFVGQFLQKLSEASERKPTSAKSDN